MDHREIVEQCGLSREMREHLVKQELSKREIVRLIVNAPVALQIKKKLLEEIAETEDLYQEVKERVDNLLPGEEDHFPEWEKVWKNSAKRLVEEYQKAIDELQLKENEFLWMEEHWFDYDWVDGNQSGGRAFQSLYAALQATRKVMQEEEWDENTLCWTELTKWSPGAVDVMENRYRYYLIRDEIVYFSKKTDRPRARGYIDPYRFDYPTEEVYFPTPFQPGDIVTLDPRPFAPPIHAVLLETRHDCCGLRGLFCGIDDLWHDVAIYHRHGWDDVSGYEPILSPIYRLSKCSFEELLPDEREVLQSVHNYIGGNESRGDEVDRLFYHGGIGPEKVLGRIRQLEKEKGNKMRNGMGE